MTVHLAAQQHRVFVERDMGLVTEPVNPTDTVDQAALDVMHVVALRPQDGMNSEEQVELSLSESLAA